MCAYELADSRVVYDGILSRIRIDSVRMPDGDTADREVVAHLDAVAVVPVTADKQVVLVRQYRHAVGQTLLEIPAGLCDVEDEDAQTTAERELAEEAGLGAERMEHLVTFHNSAGWSEEATTVFLALGLRPIAPPDGFAARHEEADMEIVRMPLGQAVAAADRGDITDAKTLAGLLLAARRLGVDGDA